MAPTSITCSMCLQRGLAAEAHVIPRAFFEELRPNRAEALERHSRGGRMTISRIGEYDRGILCRTCEDRFKSLDDYAISVLLKHVPPPTRIEVGAYLWNSVDCAKLKQFFLFLLWRASVSTRPMYAQVDLGMANELLRTYILGSTRTSPDHFGVIIAVYEHELAKMVVEPRRQTVGDVDVVVFMMGGIKAIISLGGRLPINVAPHLLGRDGRLTVMRWDWEQSFEYRYYMKEENWSAGAFEEFKGGLTSP